MTVTFCPDVESFLAKAGDLLYQEEAANSLMLGLCSRLQTGWAEGRKPVLVVLEEGGKVVSAALHAGDNLVLSFAEPAMLSALASALQQRDLDFPGVVGPANEAAVFAALWEELRGKRSTLAIKQRIYQLQAVQNNNPVPGEARLATEAEIPLIARWFAMMHGEVPLPEHSSEAYLALATQKVRDQELYLWIVDGAPVSMAGATRPTRHGMGVNAVFTPESQRRKGYATALVSHVSQAMLDQGKKFCFLYTDLGNPTSNSIYQKIGYQAAADSLYFVFGPRS
ncbi:MAG: GNAT family N-acetyltransferase [candidate division FCPU426 bacterium]